MSKSKHTPGPWERTCTAFGLLGVASVATWERIAMMTEYKDDPKYGESYANAGLMAAAPGMLAALKEIATTPIGASIAMIATARNAIAIVEPDRQHIDADGGLIAAAPELLAACEAIVYAADDPWSDAIPNWASCVDAARAAIAKAKG